MGKIRVKTLGDEEQEKEQKKEARKRQEVKKTAKPARNASQSDAGGAPGLKGGERVSAVGPTEEELESVIANEMKQSQSQEIASPVGPRNDKPTKKEKFASDKKAAHSKKYQTVAKLVDKKKAYALSEALELLPKLKIGKFDETVELHINTTETGITGSITLPHGNGKQIRVAIADDKIIESVEKGKIDFDVLLATPQMMGKLAKVAKFLGPRGLMPNPKNGTITTNPEEAAKKFAGGLMQYKTEAKTPIIHAIVGKMSFGDKKLSENIQALFAHIKTEKIKNATLKSTMSPGIKIQMS